MAIELKIHWHGNVPGLEEHRLSLAHFGEPLHLLLLALRRIATQMVSVAVEGDVPSTGRFANLARQLDIEIANIEGASSGINALLSFHEQPDALPLFSDLPDRVSLELLDAIDRESKEQPANSAVRKYLRALPNGITRQTYIIHDGGMEKKRIEIGDLRLAALPEELPFIRESEGNVVGVGFEPGRNEVRIRTDSGTILPLTTTIETVDQAISIRRETVRTLSVHDGKKSRLLKLQKAADPRFKLSEESIQENIFNRWSGVLSRLAK
jgi:hypothetical protein